MFLMPSGGDETWFPRFLIPSANTYGIPPGGGGGGGPQLLLVSRRLSSLMSRILSCVISRSMSSRSRSWRVSSSLSALALAVSSLVSCSRKSEGNRVNRRNYLNVGGLFRPAWDLRSPHFSSTAASDLQLGFEHASGRFGISFTWVCRIRKKPEVATYGHGRTAHRHSRAHRSRVCGKYLKPSQSVSTPKNKGTREKTIRMAQSFRRFFLASHAEGCSQPSCTHRSNWMNSHVS